MYKLFYDSDLVDQLSDKVDQPYARLLVHGDINHSIALPI